MFRLGLGLHFMYAYSFCCVHFVFLPFLCSLFLLVLLFFCISVPPSPLRSPLGSGIAEWTFPVTQCDVQCFRVVNGVLKRGKVIADLQQLNRDIIFLQETHLKPILHIVNEPCIKLEIF